MPTEPPRNFCSFCGKPSEEVDALVAGYGGRDPSALAATESVQASSTSPSGPLRAISICNECIDLCKAILDDTEDGDPESGFYKTAAGDESTAAKRTALSANESRAAKGQAADLVTQSNQLRDIVAELHETLGRREQERDQARRERLEDKIDRLSTLVSEVWHHLNRAEDEWKRARSRAICALIEESGLQASTPWPGLPERQARAVKGSRSCSFCGKPQEAVKKLIQGPMIVDICNECVEVIDEAIRP
jgi:hypothetical protein